MTNNDSKREGLIRYHNDLADIPLIGMTSTQANIFMVACFTYQQDLQNKFADIKDIEDTYQENIPCVEYGISDFLKLCSYTKGGPKKFIEDARDVRNALKNYSVTTGEDESIERTYPFFYMFTINKETMTLSLQIHKHAAYMLFNLRRNYTQHEIEEFIQIKNMYAKRCYRQLKKWRTVGLWKVDIEDFEEVICLKRSHKGGNLDKRVLNVIKEQLSLYFENLKIRKEYSKKKGAPIKGLIFTFTPELKSISDTKKTSHICPRCGRHLIQKTINGKTCWCHEDGWKEGAECSAIFNAVSDILEEKQKEPEEDNFPKELTEKLMKMF